MLEPLHTHGGVSCMHVCLVCRVCMYVLYVWCVLAYQHVTVVLRHSETACIEVLRHQALRRNSRQIFALGSIYKTYSTEEYEPLVPNRTCSGANKPGLGQNFCFLKGEIHFICKKRQILTPYLCIHTHGYGVWIWLAGPDDVA